MPASCRHYANAGLMPDFSDAGLNAGLPAKMAEKERRNPAFIDNEIIGGCLQSTHVQKQNFRNKICEVDRRVKQYKPPQERKKTGTEFDKRKQREDEKDRGDKEKDDEIEERSTRDEREGHFPCLE